MTLLPHNVQNVAAPYLHLITCCVWDYYYQISYLMSGLQQYEGDLIFHTYPCLHKE